MINKALGFLFSISLYAGASAATPEQEFWTQMDGMMSARGALTMAVELPLGNGAVAAAASSDEFGYLALIDHGKVQWTAHADPESPECWRGADERPCLPVAMGLLAAEPGGVRRFYVAADYYQEAGATRGHQLSLWRLIDGKAQAFYVTDYATGGDSEDQGVSVAKDLLTIKGKGFWKNFSVCGACDGRQQIRKLRVTQNGEIEDLGVTSLTPELDAVDRLLDSPEAPALLKTSWHDPIFLIDPARIGAASVCMTPEDLPPLTFRFAADSTEMRIIAVEPGPCR